MIRFRSARVLVVMALLSSSGVVAASAAIADRRPSASAPGAVVEGSEAIAGGDVSAGFGAGIAVSDGSFEQGPPPGSEWSEVINTPTNCPSGIEDWSFPEALDAPAVDGVMTYWAGGYCPGPTNVGAVEGWVEQDVAVPSSTPILIFWYAAFRDDPAESAGSDVAFIDVGGNEQWSLDVSTAANDTNDGDGTRCFVPARIDLSAFAGQVVELRVGLDSDLSELVGNVFFDDFTFADLVSADGFECGLGRWSATTP
jgi:hypothetical protein